MSTTPQSESSNLIERFINSKSLQLISTDYRVQIQKLISKGDERTIQVIKKYLDDEDELNKYLNDFVEQKAEEVTKSVVKDFKKRKNEYESMKEQQASEAKADEIINSI